jgi:uncharacterized caspase-like protein
MFRRTVIVLLCAAGLVAAMGEAAFAQTSPPNPRIALVIGEAAYPDHPLATTANDAGLIAQTLQAAGFDVVGARDLDEKSLRQALRDFIDKANEAGPDGVDFVYLSGRALQYAGDNYFVPVDAQIARDVDVPIEAVKIADFTHALAAVAGRSHVVVIDGARANGYAPGTPLAPGLALVDPEKNELIAYNAAPGTVAPDEPGPYGLYGKDLAGALRQGGVPLDDIFEQVRLQVNQDTAGAVAPWSAANLEAPVYIFERAADTSAPAVLAASRTLADQPLRSFGPERAYAAALSRDTLDAYQEYLQAYPNSPEARRVRAMLAARREAAFWRHSVRENTPRAYWTYLKRYPNGPHVADASRRLALLSAPPGPPPDFAPVDFADLPPPPPDERFYEERPVAFFGGDDFGPPPPPPPPDVAVNYGDDWRDLPPPPPPAQTGYLPVLEVAIPLIAGAVVVDYLHHHERRERRQGEERNGVAPPGLPGAPGHGAIGGPAPTAKPAAPPPLPKGVTPKAPPPPQSTPTKLLIPGTPGARPVSTAPAAGQAAPATPQPQPPAAHAPPQPQPAAPQPPATAPAQPRQPGAGATSGRTPPVNQRLPVSPGGHALPPPQTGGATSGRTPPVNRPLLQPGAHALPQSRGATSGRAPPQNHPLPKAPAPPAPAPAAHAAPEIKSAAPPPLKPHPAPSAAPAAERPAPTAPRPAPASAPPPAAPAPPAATHAPRPAPAAPPPPAPKPAPPPPAAHGAPPCGGTPCPK